MSGIGDLDSSSKRPKQVLESHPLRGRFRPALVLLRLCNRLTCWPQTPRHSFFHQELLLMAMPISDLVSLPVPEPLFLSTSSGRNTATWCRHQWSSVDSSVCMAFLRPEASFCSYNPALGPPTPSQRVLILLPHPHPPQSPIFILRQYVTNKDQIGAMQSSP